MKSSKMVWMTKKFTKEKELLAKQDEIQEKESLSETKIMGKMACRRR